MIDERTTAKFLRGLTLGAIIGAIIAGSSFWTRRHRSVSRSPMSRTTTAERTGPARSEGS